MVNQAHHIVMNDDAQTTLIDFSTKNQLLIY